MASSRNSAAPREWGLVTLTLQVLKAQSHICERTQGHYHCQWKRLIEMSNGVYVLTNPFFDRT
jgi:hypothetical protein